MLNEKSPGAHATLGLDLFVLIALIALIAFIAFIVLMPAFLWRFLVEFQVRT